MGKSTKRLSDSERWDDDWFLSLPPRYKVLCDWIREHCDGAGFKKVSFGKLSREIGEEITREGINQYFADRIHWVDENTLWYPGFIKGQYKQLSPDNQAHMNVARLAVRTVEGQSLSGKAAAVFQYLCDLLEGLGDCRPTVGGESDDSRATVIESKSKSIKNSLKRGVGENFLPPPEPDAPASPPEPAPEPAKPKRTSPGRKDRPPEFLEFWKVYPRQIEKGDAFRAFTKNVRVPEDLADLAKATANFAAVMALERREWSAIKHPATFLNEGRWRDYVDVDLDAIRAKQGKAAIGGATARPQATNNLDPWLVEADHIFAAVKKFPAGDPGMETHLGPIRWPWFLAIGRSRIAEMPPNDFSRRELAKQIQALAGQCDDREATA